MVAGRLLGLVFRMAAPHALPTEGSRLVFLGLEGAKPEELQKNHNDGE